jgi:hypothetical protein
MRLNGDIIPSERRRAMSPRTSEHPERVNVFFSTDSLTQLKSEAVSKGLTVSGLVRMIVLEHIHAHDTPQGRL